MGLFGSNNIERDVVALYTDVAKLGNKSGSYYEKIVSLHDNDLPFVITTKKTMEDYNDLIVMVNKIRHNCATVGNHDYLTKGSKCSFCYVVKI